MFNRKKEMVIVFGSPKIYGNTRELLNGFTSPFRESKEWGITEFDVYRMNPHPCTACGVCKEKEACKFHDLDMFDKKLRRADLLVVASPIYNYSFPAPLKALLDRTQRYYEARFSLNVRPSIEKHRNAVLLLTMGSDDDFSITVTKHQLERAFSVMNTELIECIACKNTDAGHMTMPDSVQKANELALELKREL